MGRGTRKVSTGGKASIPITPEGKNAIVEWQEKSALKPQLGPSMGAISLWFCRQVPVVQTAVLSGVDAGMEVHYAAALRKLADELHPQGENARQLSEKLKGLQTSGKAPPAAQSTARREREHA